MQKSYTHLLFISIWN